MNKLAILTKFSTVGVIMNFGLYGLYTVLLTIGFNYQIALTFVFILGVGLSFLFNHKWSWNDRSNAKTSFLRFCVIYSFIYLAHLSITTALVNYTLLGEYIAGLVSMIFLVVPLFIILDKWVFTAENRSA